MGLPFYGETITIVSPGRYVDAYGNRQTGFNDSSTRTTVRAQVQPRANVAVTGEELGNRSRDQISYGYQASIDPDVEVTAADRIEWNGLTFSVDGEPRLWMDVRGRRHHKSLYFVTAKG